MNLGATITRYRKINNLKQAELATKANISQEYLSHIENNKRNASLSTLEAICNQLNVAVPILFYESLEEQDIDPQKRELFYEFIDPVIKKLISKLK